MDKYKIVSKNWITISVGKIYNVSINYLQIKFRIHRNSMDDLRMTYVLTFILFEAIFVLLDFVSADNCFPSKFSGKY